jgi:hypothetical protein
VSLCLGGKRLTLIFVKKFPIGTKMTEKCLQKLFFRDLLLPRIRLKGIYRKPMSEKMAGKKLKSSF